jgi:hypothetical protein
VVVAFEGWQDGLEPGRVRVPVMDGKDGEAEDRRLGAGEVVSAVGVQHGAIMVDLVNHLIRQLSGGFIFTVEEKSERDGPAIPAVHFIEPAARHHVTVGKIEQTVLIDLIPFGRQRTQGDLIEVPRGHGLAQGSFDRAGILPIREIDRPAAVGVRTFAR